MGQTPKYFMPSTPYGSSPAANSLIPTQPGATNPQQPQAPQLPQQPSQTPLTPQSLNPFRTGGRFFAFFALLLLPFSAKATTTFTGTIQNLNTGAVTTGTYIRFWLRGCGGNQPRVSGTAVIAPSQGGVFYFDFIANGSGAVSGTLYSTRDSTGLLGGDITCGTSTTSVWYGMQIFVNGKGGPEVPIHAKNGVAFDISTVPLLTVTPVSAAPTISGTILGCSTTGGVAYENGTSNTLTCGAMTFAPGAGNQLTNPGPDVASSFAASNQTGGGANYTLSAAGNASAGVTTYTGTFVASSVLPQNMNVTISGFTNGANNGTFAIQSFNFGAQTLAVYNPSGVAETHAGNALTDAHFGSSGFNTGVAGLLQFGTPGANSTFSIRGTTYRMSGFTAPQPGALNYAGGLDGDSKDAFYHLIVNNGATGDHYYEVGGVDDGTGANPNACRYGNQGGVEDIKCSKGGGTFYSTPQIICSGQIALSTGAITSGNRATNTLSCSGLSASTDAISCTFSGDTNAVTGYAPSASGGLTLKTWVSANTINVDQVNDTGGSITPGAATVNCKGIR